MTDAAPPVAPGWTRLTLKGVLSATRDFDVRDTADNPVLFVHGRIAAHPRAEVRDPEGAVLLTVKGKLLGFPVHMAITSGDGNEVAELRANVEIVKTKMAMTLADGTKWEVHGDLIQKDYSVDAPGGPVATITQRWLKVRDTYLVDYLDSVDPALVVAVIWAVDRWLEHR